MVQTNTLALGLGIFPGLSGANTESGHLVAERRGRTRSHRVKTPARLSKGADLGIIRTRLLQSGLRSSGSAHSHIHRQV